MLLLLVSAVLVAAPLAVFALLLAVLTSVQGVATGAAVAPLVGLAVLGSWVRGWSVSGQDRQKNGSDDNEPDDDRDGDV